MSNPTPDVKVTTSDPSVRFTDAQRDKFLAAVTGALARQAAEVLAPSGDEVLEHVPRFQLTADAETVEGWFIQFDEVDSFGLKVEVGYMLTNSDFEDTDYEVVVTIKFAFEDDDALDAGRGYRDSDIGQMLDDEPADGAWGTSFDEATEEEDQ